MYGLAYAKTIGRRPARRVLCEACARLVSPIALHGLVPLATASHAHSRDDLPEDTDVLRVLSREPRSAERVTAPHRAFTIREDGSIEPAGAGP